MNNEQLDVVSVIVPVYNSEEYIRACVDSIVNQTYKNLNIILVDDGSTDSSGKICDEYAKRDDRIKVIHKKNGGNGDARNAGLKCVKGEWIVWVDNDDVIHSRQIEILLSIAKTNGLDIVAGWYRAIGNDEVPKNETINSCYMHDVQILTDRHLYDDDFIRKYSMILTVPWGKICRKELYDNVLFPARSRHDDTWTTWKIYEKSINVGLTNIVLYYWRNNPNSFSRIFDFSHLEGIDAYKEQLEYFHLAHRQRYVEIVYAEYIEMFFWCYNNMKKHSIDLRELRPYWLYIRKSVKYIKITKSLGIYMWIKYRYLVYYKIPILISFSSNNNRQN